MAAAEVNQREHVRKTLPRISAKFHQSTCKSAQAVAIFISRPSFSLLKNGLSVFVPIVMETNLEQRKAIKFCEQFYFA